jgi:predicted N-formylglutamate amidohydrolase
VTGRRVRVVVTCEHGGNRIPARYRPLFVGKARLLASHRGYDAGALELARALARRVGASLHYSEVSRLLVDLNRSHGNRSLFSELTRDLPPGEKERVLASHYYPHRLAVERRVEAALAKGYRVLHVASHSFTPLLGTEERNADVAWLYDPSRPRERELVRGWRRSLRQLRPDLRLRFNYPYRGVSDGLTTQLRARFSRGYLGIEIEVNQRFSVAGGAEAARLRRDLVESLAHLVGQTGWKR